MSAFYFSFHLIITCFTWRTDVITLKLFKCNRRAILFPNTNNYEGISCECASYIVIYPRAFQKVEFLYKKVHIFDQ